MLGLLRAGHVGPGEIPQWVSMLAVLPDNPSSVPSSRVVQFTASCNSRRRAPEVPPPQASTGMHTDAHTYTQIQIISF